MENATAAHTEVQPAFDGRTTLPRIIGWSALRERLKAGPSTGRLPEGFFDRPIGRRYAAQLQALGASGGSATVEIMNAPEGLEATIRVLAGNLILEDRWMIEVDPLGVVRECISEHGTGAWIYKASDFGRFLSDLLKAA